MMPRLSLLFLFAAAMVPFALGTVWPEAGQLGILVCLGVFLLSLVDLVVTPSLLAIEVNRDVNEVLSVGTPNSVKLWFTNRGSVPLKIHVHDEPPMPCSYTDLPFDIELFPNKHQYSIYHVEPHHRGKNRFRRVFLQMKSRLGLWTVYDERDIHQVVRIYPDIKAVHGVELMARRNRLAETGIKMSRLRGRGTEFDRLREYRRGDEFRSIDWKATSRHQELISREYVVEKNQNIIFLLDCGRSMCNADEGVTHFDRALNAAILLSYVALRQGDTVSLMACSNKVERWVPPVRGAGSIQKLIRQVYDLDPVYEASDYRLMSEQLQLRYRKRSLVVVLTHALDEVHLSHLSDALRMMRWPHLVLSAFLRNVPLQERMNAIPETDREAFQIAAAADIVATQTTQIAALQKSGLLILDTLPENLSVNLISRYLDIKARQLL
ncbi:DUF58 domain-containing protein [Gimesia chilikensis]|jgi:uncharacterized protein (DUF58 family)|uniref:DUF58 domain-containing protein n=1 Tax=Gimesia chilikensis TaxID=2605989 RepID=UPI000C44514F|nr:DUF58 domain-containing protein [Gimesia chilikensis]MBN73328.1 hypothetical protein [Gimesia sp.]QDT87535.1 hypothetical protein MalM14_52220 [Gimesia chilikensis]